MNPIGAQAAERLLEGSTPDGQVGPELEPIAAILRSAGAPARPDEVRDAPEAIRRIFDEARRPPPAPTPVIERADERRLVGRWSLRAAVVAAIAAITLSGGAALAATGNLPGPLQAVASDALGTIGIDVPDGEGETDPSADVPAQPDADDPDEGEPATDPSSDGGGSPVETVAPPATTTPPVALSTPDPTTPPVEGGVPGLGDETCTVASDGRCQAGDHGKADEAHPPETTPADTRPDPPVDRTPPSNPSVTRPTGPPDDRGKPEK